jgi:hypothetical protein
MRSAAVIANANAHGVTPARIELARQILGPAHVFVTRSLAEARAAAAAIAGRYQVVCTGGGDGTFVQAIADLGATGQPLPILFGLRLGSGTRSRTSAAPARRPAPASPPTSRAPRATSRPAACACSRPTIGSPTRPAPGSTPPTTSISPRS